MYRHYLIKYEIDYIEYLRQFKKKHKLTEYDIAKNTGVSKVYLNNILNNKRPLTLNFISKIRRYYETFKDNELIEPTINGYIEVIGDEDSFIYNVQALMIFFFDSKRDFYEAMQLNPDYTRDTINRKRHVSLDFYNNFKELEDKLIKEGKLKNFTIG